MVDAEFSIVAGKLKAIVNAYREIVGEFVFEFTREGVSASVMGLDRSRMIVLNLSPRDYRSEVDSVWVRGDTTFLWQSVRKLKKAEVVRVWVEGGKFYVGTLQPGVVVEEAELLDDEKMELPVWKDAASLHVIAPDFRRVLKSVSPAFEYIGFDIDAPEGHLIFSNDKDSIIDLGPGQLQLWLLSMTGKARVIYDRELFTGLFVSELAEAVDIRLTETDVAIIEYQDDEYTLKFYCAPKTEGAEKIAEILARPRPVRTKIFELREKEIKLLQRTVRAISQVNAPGDITFAAQEDLALYWSTDNWKGYLRIPPRYVEWWAPPSVTVSGRFYASDLVRLLKDLYFLRLFLEEHEGKKRLVLVGEGPKVAPRELVADQTFDVIEVPDVRGVEIFTGPLDLLRRTVEDAEVAQDNFLVFYTTPYEINAFGQNDVYYSATFALDSFQMIEENHVSISGYYFKQLAAFFRQVPAMTCTLGKSEELERANDFYLTCETTLGEFKAIVPQEEYQVKAAEEAYRLEIERPVAPPEIEKLPVAPPPKFPPITLTVPYPPGLSVEGMIKWACDNALNHVVDGYIWKTTRRLFEDPGRDEALKFLRSEIRNAGSSAPGAPSWEGSAKGIEIVSPDRKEEYRVTYPSLLRYVMNDVPSPKYSHVGRHVPIVTPAPVAPPPEVPPTKLLDPAQPAVAEIRSMFRGPFRFVILNDGEIRIVSMGKFLTKEELEARPELLKEAQEYFLAELGTLGITPAFIELVTVYTLTHIFQFTGVDRKLYGPYAAGMAALIPRENAEMFVKERFVSWEKPPPPVKKLPTEEEVLRVVPLKWRPKNEVLQELQKMDYTETDIGEKLEQLITEGKIERDGSGLFLKKKEPPLRPPTLPARAPPLPRHPELKTPQITEEWIEAVKQVSPGIKPLVVVTPAGTYAVHLEKFIEELGASATMGIVPLETIDKVELLINLKKYDGWTWRIEDITYSPEYLRAREPPPPAKRTYAELEKEFEGKDPWDVLAVLVSRFEGFKRDYSMEDLHRFLREFRERTSPESIYRFYKIYPNLREAFGLIAGGVGWVPPTLPPPEAPPRRPPPTRLKPEEVEEVWEQFVALARIAEIIEPLIYRDRFMETIRTSPTVANAVERARRLVSSIQRGIRPPPTAPLVPHVVPVTDAAEVYRRLGVPPGAPVSETAFQTVYRAIQREKAVGIPKGLIRSELDYLWREFADFLRKFDMDPETHRPEFEEAIDPDFNLVENLDNVMKKVHELTDSGRWGPERWK